MTDATPLASEQITQEDRIAVAIGKADAAFGYSFNLTRLVDGEETHTLSMPGFDPVEFSDRDEGYALIAERRNKARAEAVLAALSASPAPSGQGVSGEVECNRCAGNGEIVTDWPLYMHGRVGVNADDEATKDCPDCDGTGRLAAPAPSCAPGEVEGEPCRFVDCPPGLFRWGGLLCFKSEYSSKPGQPDAYCVDSGEYFWGGTSGDLEKRRNLIVTPLAAALSPQGLDAKEGGE